MAKVLVLGKKDFYKYFQEQGIQTTTDPGEDAEITICDSTAYQYAPENTDLYIVKSGGINDWVIKQSRPNAHFVSSPQEALDAIKSLRNTNEIIKLESPKERILITVYANKGGVGKTSCAINIAEALKRIDIPVVLCDFDFGGPNVSAFYNIPPLSNYLNMEITEHNILTSLVNRDGIYILPASSDTDTHSLKGDQLVKILDILTSKFSAVVVDTMPAPTKEIYMHPVFEKADIVYAVVNQSKFSIEETSTYAPSLIFMNVEPQKVKIIVNQYNPRLTSIKSVEKAFSSKFKKGVKNIIKVTAVIPENWEEQVKASHKGTTTNHEEWDKLATDIAHHMGRTTLPAEKKSILKVFSRKKG